MPKIVKRLTEKQVAQLRAPGKYAVDRGLYLLVTPAESASGAVNSSWVFRFTSPDGRRRAAGIGPTRDVPLKEAIDIAAEWRLGLRKGIDPIEARRARREATADVRQTTERQRRLAAATLERVCREYHEIHAPTLRSGKHEREWLESLKRHVFSELGPKPIGAVTIDEVRSLLVQLRDVKRIAETGARIRQRLEVVFDYAIARELATANPARQVRVHFKGRRAEMQHFRALPFVELPAFIATLRESSLEAAVKLALELVTLTAARTNEVLGATWSEIDLTTAEWRLPPQRMKGAIEHRVPLSKTAIAVLEQARELAGDPFVFPHPTEPGGPLPAHALLLGLRHLGLAGRTTVHGLRSAFSTWAYETTKFRGDVIESALAHREANQVKAAYQRGDFLAQRRGLMQAWAAFLEQAPAKVIKLRTA